MKFFSRILGNGQMTIADRELYLFKFGNSERCYTNGDAFIEYAGRSYEPHVLERQSHKRGRDLEKETMEIAFSLQSEFAQNLSRSELEGLVTVEMFSFKHDTFKPFWSGRLTKVKPHSDGIKLQFETSFTKVGRNAVTRKIQASCPYRLFDQDCRLNREDYIVRTTIKSIDKLNLVLRGLESYAENYFAIGMIEHPDGVLITIDTSVGNNLILKRRYDSFSDLALTDEQYTDLMNDIAAKQLIFDDATSALESAELDLATKTQIETDAQAAVNAALPEDPGYQDLLDALAQAQVERLAAETAVADAQTELQAAQADLQAAQDAVPYVTLSPGCMRTPTACKSFDNMPNYGGFPFLPTDNPLAKEIA